uniref:Reverse transcriptase domain-containing protein n=1 Tax=Tanacetum cinerariifolium TaxID=118510 RepID=A0A699I9U3_TANCI|nr:hypothetical protein [Tanacetum cinerariifolium]
MSQGYREPVTYTSVYTDSEPWRYYGEDSAETGPPRVIVYGYDGLPIQPVAPPSLDYVPGLEHPSSPDYVPGPEHTPAPAKDQPLPDDASLIAASPDYVANSDLEEDLKEDPVDDQADYPANGGDGDDEPSDNDDDDITNDKDLEEEPFEEDEHLAPVDSSTVPIVDPVLSAGEIETLEADEPTHAPGSPIRVPLGYRAARIRMRALITSTSYRIDIPEADMPPQKRTCLTTPAPEFEIGESYAAGAARQPGPTESDLRRCRVEQAAYGITDTWDEIVDKMMDIAPTTLEGVNERVMELDTTVRQRADEDRSDHRRTAMLMDREAMYSRETQLTMALGRIEVLEARDPDPQEGPAEASISWTFVYLLAIIKMAPKKRTTRATPATTTTPTTTVTNAQLQALIDRGVAAALAERDANISRNCDNKNNSGTGGRRQMTTPRECTYTNFLKCQPISFQGTEGVVFRTWWIEKMESVFQINKCIVTCQVKFASCTLQGSALTRWNSHMRAVGQDIA